jgi:hypothetical protein
MTDGYLPITREKLYIVRIWINNRKKYSPVSDFFLRFPDPTGLYPVMVYEPESIKNPRSLNNG